LDDFFFNVSKTTSKIILKNVKVSLAADIRAHGWATHVITPVVVAVAVESGWKYEETMSNI